MKISLERNTQDDQGNTPYFVQVEVITATVDAGTTFDVPVVVRHEGTKKIFTVDICGFRFERENPNELQKLVGGFLPKLINLARLPSYIFIARRAKGLYPVYTHDSEVFATTPGGPVFRHVELAKVREYLTDYLHNAGVLGKSGVSNRLHVRGVNMKTLGLRRPVFYLKKRVPGQIDFWAPVFETGDGRRIYTYAANHRRQAPIAGGVEVLYLQEIVAEVLITDKRLVDPLDLRPDRLFPGYWERLEATLTQEQPISVNGIDMPIYKIDDKVIGLEVRQEEGRYSLFLGKSVEDVRRHAEVDFARRGVGKELIAV